MDDRPRRASRPSAFTLLEILVVLAVITILVGAVVPDLSRSYRSMQQKAAASRIGDMMAFCYSAAAAQRSGYRLYVDAEQGRLWAMREVELENGEREYQVVQFPGMQSYLLPGMVELDPEEVEQALNEDEEGAFYIQFRRDGTCDFARLTLLSPYSAPIRITLNGLTGRVKIREVEPEELGETME